MIVKVAGIYFIFFILRFGGFAFSRPSPGKETSQSRRRRRSPPSSAGRDAATLQHRSSLALTKQLPRDQHQHPAVLRGRGHPHRVLERGQTQQCGAAPQGGGEKAASKRLFPAPSSCPRCFWGRSGPVHWVLWGSGWAERCCDRPSPLGASGLTSIHFFHNLSWDADSAVSKCTGQQL